MTRSRSQASELSRGLRDLGADVAELPTLDIVPLEETPGLEAAIGQIGSFSWIVFTSINGVEIFFDRLAQRGLDARVLAGARVAAMGPGTAAGLRRRGVQADLVPERYTSEGVLQSFASRRADYRGERFLFPGSQIAREVLPEGLESLGAQVVRLPIYANRVPVYTAEELDECLGEHPDLVTFTSSSTVTHLADILQGCGRDELLRRLPGASIGPVTSATARELGVPVAVEAQAHTIPGLIQAIQAHFAVGQAP